MNGRQKISIAVTIAMAVLILVTAISSSNYFILVAYLFGLTSADNMSWLVGRVTQKSRAEK
jgi:hypothetical protein